MAIHEFDTETLDQKAIAKTTEKEWAKKILPNCKTVEANFWNLKGSFGDKKFFH
jgi:hypothetical protein